MACFLHFSNSLGGIFLTLISEDKIQKKLVATRVCIDRVLKSSPPLPWTWDEVILQKCEILANSIAILVNVQLRQNTFHHRAGKEESTDSKCKIPSAPRCGSSIRKKQVGSWQMPFCQNLDPHNVWDAFSL